MVGEHYYARLTVAEEGLDPELRERIKAQGVPESWMADSGEDFLSVEDSEALHGEFAELEAELVRRGVAFDRYTDGYGSFQPRERRFRPARDGRGPVDVEVLLTVDGEPYVVLGELKKLLAMEDAGELRRRLAGLVAEAEPVPPLDEEPG